MYAGSTKKKLLFICIYYSIRNKRHDDQTREPETRTTAPPLPHARRAPPTPETPHRQKQGTGHAHLANKTTTRHTRHHSSHIQSSTLHCAGARCTTPHYARGTTPRHSPPQITRPNTPHPRSVRTGTIRDHTTPSNSPIFMTLPPCARRCPPCAWASP